jgi:hypothetical protein
MRSVVEVHGRSVLAMSAHMIGIVLMAIATITIITVGTLAAAGMLTRGRPESRPDDRPARGR